MSKPTLAQQLDAERRAHLQTAKDLRELQSLKRPEAWFLNGISMRNANTIQRLQGLVIDPNRPVQ